MRQLLLKLFKVKKRNEIRNGKLWEITTVWGFAVFKVERKPAEADPFIKPEGGAVDKMRVHVIAGENNVTNLTKEPELL